MLQGLARQLKGAAYTEAQNEVREVTSNDDRFPTDRELRHIVKLASIGSNNFAQISSVLWRRIFDLKFPRHVFKSLVLLTYLVSEGTNKDMFIQQALQDKQRLDALNEYHSDPLGGDYHLDVDIRATAIVLNRYLAGDRTEPLVKEEQADPFNLRHAQRDPGLTVAPAQPAEAKGGDDSSEDSSDDDRRKKKKKKKKKDKKKKKKKKKKSQESIRADGDDDSSDSDEGDSPPKAKAPAEARASGGQSGDLLDLFAAPAEQPPQQKQRQKQSQQPRQQQQEVDLLDMAFGEVQPQQPQRREEGAQDDSNPFDDFPSMDDVAPAAKDDGNPFGDFEDPFASPKPKASAASHNPFDDDDDDDNEAAREELRRRAAAQQQFSVLGDFAAEFGGLSERAGGAARPFDPFNTPLPEFKGSLDDPAPKQQPPAPQEEKKKERKKKKTTKKKKPAPQQQPPPQRQAEPKRRSLKKKYLDELGAYTRYLSLKLGDEAPPLARDGSDLLDKLEDGVLLARFINHVHGETIDLRTLNTAAALSAEERQENANLVLSAAQSLGVRTGITSLDGTRHPVQIMSILAQLVKISLLEDISLQKHPELVALCRDANGRVDDTLIAQLLQQSPDTTLLRWVHHVAGVPSDQTIKLNDSVVYGRLLNALIAAAPEPDTAPPTIDMEALLAEPDLEKRAAQVLGTARRLGVEFELQSTDVTGGNPRLNLALTAALFHINTGIRDDDVGDDERKELLQVEKAEMLEYDRGDTREERAFRMWVNSLGLDGLYVNSLFADTRDGLVWLKLLDYVAPGCVDWTKVEKRPTNRFKKVGNCVLVVDIGKGKLGFTLVNVAGVDLVDGQRKLVLAFAWQLMRFHTFKYLNEVLKGAGGASTGKGADHLVLQWANARLAAMRAAHPHGRAKSPPLRSFGDASLSNSFFFLDLLWALQPRLVDWSLVTPGADAEQKLSNALYAISIARKLGAVIFLLPEDIVEVNARLILTFLCGLMVIAEQRTAR